MMMKRQLSIFASLLAILPAFSAPIDKGLLDELDRYVRERGNYESRKQESLSILRDRLRRAHTDMGQFDACMDLADAFFSYQFDSTQYYLKHAQEYAAGNAELEQTAGIRLGYLYVKSGSYMEAYDRLYLRTDTTSLTDGQKVDYYFALFEFCRDLSGNSGMVERLSIPDRAVYRDRLFGLLEPGSELYRRLEMDALMASYRFAEADQLKEAYIARFLGYLSANVAMLQQEDHHTRKLLTQGRSEELLKEISTSTRTEDALNHFYRIFDETFLGIYPDFVAQFNALLRPDAQVRPRKGELLSTEIRIFALIRLGIDDSKEIASMLHYSVSTIYNYKVSVKNGAAGDRVDFENQVRSIQPQAASAAKPQK